MIPTLKIDPAHSFTFFPLAPHVGGSGDLMVVGTAKRFEEVARYSFRVLAYRFDRAIVRKRNLAPFLEFFDMERIARAGLLHGLHNRVMMDFTGYEEGDTRPLHKRTEIRDFLRLLVARWPYYWYVAFLPVPSRFLQDLAFCISAPIEVRDPDSPSGWSVAPTEEQKALYQDTFLPPCLALCERDPLLQPALVSPERVEALLDALASPGNVVPDAGPDITRATIVRQDDPLNAMAACLESVFRDVGLNIPQQEWRKRVCGPDDKADDTGVWRNLNEALREHGYVVKVVDTTCTSLEARVANFRHTVARYRGIYALLLTRHWNKGDGERRCVRLLGTRPLVRVMNPDGGTVETWSERALLEREISVLFLVPWEYATIYPNGGPVAEDEPVAPPVETELPPPAERYPDEIKPQLIQALEAELARQPKAEPDVNPLTGLTIPRTAELIGLIVQEDLFTEVDRQLRDAQAPAIRQAYDRMVISGAHVEQARELITRIYAAYLRQARAEGRELDFTAYTRELVTLSGGEG